MKRFPLILLILTGLGCQNAGTPQKACTRYWQDLLNADFERVYDCFSFNDRAMKSREEFVQDMALTASETSALRVAKDLIAYKIVSAQITGDSARVAVTITLPEAVRGKFKRMLETASRETPVDLPNQPPLVTFEGFNRLIREDNAWFIFGDWETARKQEGEKARLRMEYLAKLKVKNVLVREYQKNRKYYLSFDLVNTGSQTLNYVQVMITCLDKENRPCQIISQNVVSETTRPLGPNERRKIKLDVSSLPGEWNLGTLIKVVDCGFVESR
jgi:hypothetical protein